MPCYAPRAMSRLSVTHPVVRGAGVVVLVALVGLAWICFGAMDAFPGYSPRKYFISFLGAPFSPEASAINRGFMVCGVVIGVFAALIRASATQSATRTAAWLSIASAIALVLVGVFPVDAPIPHHVAALVLVVLALAAGLFSARATRPARAPEHPRRWFAWAALIVVVLQWTTIFVGIGYIGWVTADLDPGSTREWLQRLPRALIVQSGLDWMNPLAIVEWVFFLLTAVLLAGAAAWVAVPAATAASDV